MVMFPDFVRQDLNGKSLVKLTPEILLGLKGSSFLYDYLDNYDIDINEFTKIDGLLIIPHSSFVQRFGQYRNTIKDMCAAIKKRNFLLAAKYHPRQSEDDFLNLRSEYGVKVLPRSFPIELIYLLSFNNIRFVLSDVSTALITAKWLRSDLKAISYAKVIGHSDGSLFRVFENVGVQFVSKIENINQLI
jgi:hypothetical protein